MFVLSSSEGEVRPGEPLAARTTLRVGGPAEIYVEARNEKGLAKVLREANDTGRSLTLMGRGSNVLVADEGLRGFVVALAGEFLEVSIDGDRIRAGGGATLGGVCAKAARAGLSGIESISGIPSSIGGAVRINAGAYGGEIFDVLESVRLVSRTGEISELRAGDIAHGYRWTALIDNREIVAAANLLLKPAPAAEIEARTRSVADRRRGALPSEPNAGSVFKNPPGDFAGRLLEACGLKGERRGGAEISSRHANVIVNRDGAKAVHVLELMRLMRQSVLEKFGVELRPEIELLGLRWP